MMYLSKGIMVKGTTDNEEWVSLHGKMFALGPRLTALWSYAERKPREVRPEAENAILRMEQAGLVVTTKKSGKQAIYELLSQCVLCPDWGTGWRLPLWHRDQRMWRWLSRAGLRLTTCELVCLEEQHLLPTSELLGENNRQALTEVIYTSKTIKAGALESAMECSPVRDLIVASLLRLLRRRYLFLV